MTSKLTELGKAIMNLISEYDRAKESDHIRKPISYALYQTWRMWDSKEKKRKERCDMTREEASKILYHEWQAFLEEHIDYGGISEAYKIAIKALEQEQKTDKALNLLAEWAVECGFGYDNIPEQYEKYKDDIADMGYAEGLAYIAQMESEVSE